MSSLLLDSFVLREAAHLLKMPKAAVVNCMEEFYCRARTAIGCKAGLTLDSPANYYFMEVDHESQGIHSQFEGQGA